MANPNIVGVTIINGNNGSVAVTSTAQTLINNAASSNKIFKVNQIYVSNVDGTDSDNVTVTLRSAVATTPTTATIAKNINVPAKATLEVLSAPFYLKEDQDIQVVGVAASGDLEAVATWEEIS
jgi:polysaccharide deacetylase 2 family uncharacterized protein YibQ